MTRWFGRHALILLSCCLMALPVSGSGSRLAVRDDTGRDIQLSQPAQRIITLAPFLTELVFAAGSGDLLVGVSAHSDYPDAASALPRVGDAYGLDFERLVSLHPDLVLAWASGNGATQIDRLRQLGLTVYVSEPQRLGDVESTLERLGTMMGRQQPARVTAAAFRSEIDVLRDRYSGQPTVRVFYELWHQPWITVGGSHLISDVIALCGGRNVFADVAELAPVVDIEAIVSRDPEVVLVGAEASEADSVQQRWRRWMLASAVRDGHVYVVPPELLQRQTTRIAKGAARVCELIARARK